MQRYCRNSTLLHSMLHGETAESYPSYIQLNPIYAPKSPLIGALLQYLPTIKNYLLRNKKKEILDKVSAGCAISQELVPGTR